MEMINLLEYSAYMNQLSSLTSSEIEFKVAKLNEAKALSMRKYISFENI